MNVFVRLSVINISSYSGTIFYKIYSITDNKGLKKKYTQHSMK